MLFDFANVLVFVGVGIGFIFVSLLLGRFLRPSVPEGDKGLSYDCGELPVGDARLQFNFRFYLVALIFIIFDVEIAFMFPVATVFRSWIANGQGLVALIEILLFVLILFVGLVYVWAKGDISWQKTLRSEE
ncbi:MAG: NADH-quinone oxidoreductase subunit A [bacterium]